MFFIFFADEVAEPPEDVTVEPHTERGEFVGVEKLGAVEVPDGSVGGRREAGARQQGSRAAG